MKAPINESEGSYMADQDRNFEIHDLRHSTDIGEDDQYRSAESGFREETAAEIAAPVTLRRERDYDHDRDRDRVDSGRGVGYAALALSVLSLFIMPILFGAAGIVLGFVARRRGAEASGSWAIGIGAVSIIIGIFILPFF